MLKSALRRNPLTICARRAYSFNPLDNNPFVVKPRIPEYFLIHAHIIPRSSKSYMNLGSSFVSHEAEHLFVKELRDLEEIEELEAEQREMQERRGQHIKRNRRRRRFTSLQTNNRKN